MAANAERQVDEAQHDREHAQGIMKRLFGVGKSKEPAPTLTDASDRCGARASAMEAKIAALDKQLMECKQQMAKAPPAQKARIRQRAAQILKQRKMCAPFARTLPSSTSTVVCRAVLVCARNALAAVPV